MEIPVKFSSPPSSPIHDELSCSMSDIAELPGTFMDCVNAVDKLFKNHTERPFSFDQVQTLYNLRATLTGITEMVDIEDSNRSGEIADPHEGARGNDIGNSDPDPNPYESVTDYLLYSDNEQCH
ncbi:hypothetical protein BGZ50_003965 [Haplosporangium sp. Z 11]|nr:hypothetical protein BGZ50_003965 [Haplosporangium sp. Z 11]